jgi:undecaprenyl diphosphate synthase
MHTYKTQGLHVAIIMDGNGRWATRRGLPRVAGHGAGVEAIRRVVESAPKFGIRRLTMYAFSSDNWRRPAPEVEGIFALLSAYLRLETDRLRQRGVRLRIIGRRDRLPEAVLREIERAEGATAEVSSAKNSINDGRVLDLVIAIDYSSREAIAQAVVREIAILPSDGGISHASVAECLARSFATCSADVDLLIRSGGEKRLSDFLLWESAYAELVFTDRMWPDFDEADLRAAVGEFNRRERRFGNVPRLVAPGAAVHSRPA